MLKIFLTGDNHIGLKYASHSRAAVLCAKRIAAFADMVSAANAEGCNLFVIAGDLFENTYDVAKRDIAAVLDALSAFRGTVAVLPGNHDYYDPAAKLWQSFGSLLSSYDNILLLNEYRPYPLVCGESEVVLYPALCTSLHSAPGQNNLGWMKACEIPRDGKYRIGVAHGAVEGETIDSEGAYFLMRRAELEEIPMDVWLIGHTHVPFPRDLKADSYTAGEKIFNAGTHVQTDVSCNTEGQCFFIELDKTGVRAKKFRSGNLRFFRKAVALRAGEMEKGMREALEGIADDSVVELILTGAVSCEEYENRGTMSESLLSRFLEGSYSDSALSRLISEDLIDAEFPETSFSARFLKALLKDPKEAQLAYELLKSAKREKR